VWPNSSKHSTHHKGVHTSKHSTHHKGVHTAKHSTHQKGLVHTARQYIYMRNMLLGPGRKQTL
jgi:hypothetical protein